MWSSCSDGLPLALLVAAAALSNGPRDMREALPVAALFVAMLLAVRNVPLFPIAAAPLAAHSLDALFLRFRGSAEPIAEMERFALISIGVAVIGPRCSLRGCSAWSRRQYRYRASLRSATRGAAPGLLRKLLRLQRRLSSYPSLRVFMDGRADPYPLSVWRSYLSVIRLTPSWQGVLGELWSRRCARARGSRFAAALSKETRTGDRSFEDGGFRRISA